MVTEIDNMGRINLSRRAVLEGSSGDDGYIEEEQGEIPSPLTRRTSTLAPTRSPQPRPMGGGYNRPRGGGGGNRGRGGRGGGGPSGPRPPRPPRQG
jgi:hypothetical protein